MNSSHTDPIIVQICHQFKSLLNFSPPQQRAVGERRCLASRIIYDLQLAWHMRIVLAQLPCVVSGASGSGVFELTNQRRLNRWKEGQELKQSVSDRGGDTVLLRWLV